MIELAIPETPYEIEDDVRAVVERQLAGRNDAGPISDRLMFHLETRAIHRWQSEAWVEGHRFLSDEGTGQGGSSIGPAPLRYFVGGIVIALQIWIIKIVALHGIKLSSLRCGADTYREAGSDEDFPEGRGFSRIVLLVDIKTDFQGDPSRISELVEEAVSACPATVTILRALSLDIDIVHNGESLKSFNGDSNRAKGFKVSDPSIANSDDTDELIQLEEMRCAAMAARDWKFFEEILADEFTYTHTQGHTENKAEYIASMKARDRSVARLRTEVSLYRHTAVMQGEAEFTMMAERAQTSIDDVPKPVRRSRHILMQVWIQKSGKWQLVAIQGTRTGETLDLALRAGGNI